MTCKLFCLHHTRELIGSEAIRIQHVKILAGKWVFGAHAHDTPALPFNMLRATADYKLRPST